MRVAVFGTGGVGGYFGAKLAHAGVQTSFVARGQHLAQMRATGLTIRSPAGDMHVENVNATNDPSEIGEVDVVLLAVKSWQIDDAIEGLLTLMGTSTFVVPLLNGVEAAARLGQVLGAQRVVPGTCKILSYVNAPGEIVDVGGKARLAFGESDGGQSDRTRSLLDAFQHAGVRAEIPDSIQTALWSKFLFVASLGGVGAVTRAPFGVLREIPETRAMVTTAMHEIHALAAAQGVSLPDDEVDKAMAFVDRLPVQGTTSLQRDIAAGRRSELDAWSGAVSRLGSECQVDTPMHRFLHHALLPLELQAKGALVFPA